MGWACLWAAGLWPSCLSTSRLAAKAWGPHGSRACCVLRAVLVLPRLPRLLLRGMPGSSTSVCLSGAAPPLWRGAPPSAHAHAHVLRLCCLQMHGVLSEVRGPKPDSWLADARTPPTVFVAMDKDPTM